MKKRSLREFERQCRRAGRSTPYLPETIAPGPEPKRWAPVLSAACASCVVIALTAVVVLYGTPLGQNWLRPAGAGPAASATRSSADTPYAAGTSTAAAQTPAADERTQGTQATQTTKPAAPTKSPATTGVTIQPGVLQNPQTLEGYKQALDLVTGSADFRMTDTFSREWILVPSDDSFTGLSQAERTEMLAYMRAKGLDVREMTMAELIAGGLVTEHTLVHSDNGSIIPYKTYHGAAGLTFQIDQDDQGGYVLRVTLYYGPLGAEGIRPAYERADGGWRLLPPENKVMA